MPTRQYSSPLRERQAQQTRELILGTLTEMLEDHRVDEITTRELARAAGVSESTVYRYFPDREALLAGLSEQLGKLTGEGHPGGPIESVDDLSRAAVHLMAGLDEYYAAARAEALFNADPRRFAANTHANTMEFTALVAASFPELDEGEQMRLAAVTRCLLSAQAWLRMREEFGVLGRESGPTVAWVLDTIFSEVRRGSRPG